MMDKSQKIQFTVCAIVLQGMENRALAAANLAFTWKAFIGERNPAYKPMLENNLIKEDGTPTFDLEVLASVIGKKIEMGTFSPASKA